MTGEQPETAEDQGNKHAYEPEEEKPKKQSEFRQLQEDHRTLKSKVDRLQEYVYRSIGPDE